MRVISLASGSKGNAYCVETQGGALLVDCGLSFRELGKRCQLAGVDVSQIVAVVLTHNHDDHTKGLSAFHSNIPDAVLYANMMTAEAVAASTGMSEDDFAIFENHQRFEAGPFSVFPFSVPHDVPDPVGFLIEAEGVTYFHATDVGTPLESIGRYLSEADVATLESNHDPVMLSQSNRPESIKRRIRGQRGHLSNYDAASLVRRYANARLKKLFLAHLSGECNAIHIAEEVMRSALSESCAAGVSFETLTQDSISSFTC